MAQQEDGWPLGLRPLNVRVGLVRNPEFSGSISFSTLVTGSPTSSTDSSSDLDTESTGSFFPDKSITLGNLMGVTSTVELSARGGRPRVRELVESKNRCKSRSWFPICTKACISAQSPDHPPSLAHFLEVERRAAIDCTRNRVFMAEELDEISGIRPITEYNSLFVNGQVAPPQDGIDSSVAQDLTRANGHIAPLLFSCLCAQATH